MNKKSNRFSPDVRERAVRMVQEHRGSYPSLWTAVESIAPKIGCTAETLLEWFKRTEIDAGQRAGVTTAEAQRVKELEREVKELRRANEILKTASAFFAQAELDRQFKRSRPISIAIVSVLGSSPFAKNCKWPLHATGDTQQGSATEHCAAKGLSAMTS
jgi:transposase-like protein